MFQLLVDSVTKLLILAKVQIKILADFAKYIEIYKLGAPESTRGVAPTIYIK